MKCPLCNTINRDDRTVCYHCNGDLSVLRTVIHKARQHYNQGLEHAERGRIDDAVAELKTAVSIYNDFAQAHNVLGTLYAKQEKWEHAIAQWQQTLNLDPLNKKAGEYLYKAKLELEEPILNRQARLSKQITAAVCVILAVILIWHFRINSLDNKLQSAEDLIQKGNYVQAYKLIQTVSTNKISYVHRREARILEEDLKETLNSKLKEFNTLLSQGKYNECGVLMDKLRQSGVPPSWQDSLSKAEESLYFVVVQNAINEADRLYKEKGDYPAVKGIFGNVTGTVKDKKYLDKINEKLAFIQNDWFNKNLEVAEGFSQKKEFEKANGVLIGLRQEKPDKNQLLKIEELEKSIKKEMNTQLLVTAKQLIKSKKYDEFLKTAEQVDISLLSDADKQWLNQQNAIAKNPPQTPPKSQPKKTGKK